MEEEMNKNMSKSNPVEFNLLNVKRDKKILGNHELTYMMHKFKSYYNFLQKLTLDNKGNIEQQKILERKYENLLKEGVINFKECGINDDITLFTTSSSENIKMRVENLQIAKKELLMNLEHEHDYSQSLRVKLMSERENILYYHDLEIEVRDKLKIVTKSVTDLDENQSEHSKKTRNLRKTKDELDDKIRTMNSLVYTQTSKGGQISKNLELRRNELIHDKETLTKKNIKMEKTTVEKKNRYKELIRSVDKIKTNKIENENRVIKTILGLDLLKRYI